MTRRIVANAPATLRHRFRSTPAGAVSVDASLADGTAVLTGVAATDAGAGIWTVDVDAADLPEPDELAVDWDAGSSHVETDVVEVAGGAYTTPDEVQALHTGLSSLDDSQIEASIAAVERRIEEFCGVSFVRRFARRRIIGDGTAVLWLPRPLVEIRSVTVDGTTVDPADWTVDEDGRVERDDTTFDTDDVIVVEYVHGYQAPPADLREAAVDAVAVVARERVNRHTPARAEFAEGTSWVVATADPERGRLFGIPTLDSVFQQHRHPDLVVA